MAHGTTPCASGIAISQASSARMTATQRGMVTLFGGLDSGIPDGLLGDVVAVGQVGDAIRDLGYRGRDRGA
jgi:hypothetical protein